MTVWAARGAAFPAARHDAGSDQQQRGFGRGKGCERMSKREIKRMDVEAFEDVLFQVDGWKDVEKAIIEHDRWSVTIRLVTRDAAGDLWAVVYDRPATEMQEVGRPDSYELHPVVAAEKVVTVYVPEVD
jgi:hypothetical protein